ncbi:MAG TPA: hypothetical protein VFY91_01440 [Microbacterium sp.]|nr:hypothetical protein [Microbacterium sp.]
MKRNTNMLLGAGAALVLALSMGAGPAAAHNGEDHSGKETRKGADKTVTLTANLTALNDSGASGWATAIVRNQKIQHIEVYAEGLTPDAPHAQHIHYGEQALNECPGLGLDANRDGRLNTVEGVPAYGPVVVSLNTVGDTTPGSFLDVSRFPVSQDGSYHYSRDNIEFTDVAGTGYPGAGGLGTAKEIADAIRAGEGVLVIHGVDYDGDGMYSFGAAGASELDPNLPAEATDPAVCGVLR